MRDLAPEFRQAALFAAGLVVAMFLPWYEKKAFVPTGQGELASGSETLSAFEVISFVEAAVLLVAAGVLFLAYSRMQRRPFHLPGGDGTIIMLAGAWAALLLIWRLFDKPDVEGTGVTVGIAWGWFVALLLAAGLAVSGWRLRAAHRPEPPNPVAEEEDEWVAAPPPRRERSRERRRPAAEAAVTEVLSDRPAWEGEPPDLEPPRRRRPPPDEPAP